MRSKTHLRFHKRGLTFIELMLVLVILATLITVSYPSLKGVHEHNKLKGATRELGALIRYARAKAVFEAKVAALFLEKENQAYYVVTEEEPDEYGKSPTRSYIERVHTLPAGVWFAKIKAENDPEQSPETSYILFFPNGTATEALVVLENRWGNKMTLKVSRSTAQVEAIRGLDEKQETTEPVEEVAEFY